MYMYLCEFIIPPVRKSTQRQEVHIISLDLKLQVVVSHHLGDLGVRHQLTSSARGLSGLNY